MGPLPATDPSSPDSAPSPASPDSAPSPASPDSPSARAGVSIVLIHGGSTTGRYWDLVSAALTHPALAVDLPGRGGRPADLLTVTLEDAVASVTRDTEALGTEVVLVAHSSGGLVVPGVV